MKLKYLVMIGACFLALVVLVAVALGLTKVLENRSIAEVVVVPSEIGVVNLTESSASISWTTNVTAVGKVKLLGANGGDIFYDDRDLVKDADKFKRKLHIVTIKNLKPSTEYKYLLVLNDKEYGADKNLSLTTLSSQASLPTPKPIYGQADTDTGETSGLIVKMVATTTSGETLPLVSVTNQSGGYSFDLSNLRLKSGERVNLQTQDKILVDLKSEDGKQALITVFVQ